MTVRAPIIGTDTDTAETFRLALGGLYVPASALNARTGVTSVPVLNGTGNFTATVSAFTAIVDGTSNSLQGAYPVAVDAATTITIGAANPSNPRIDLISLQIQDNAYDASGFSRGQLIVTAGTPSGSPVAPSTPANAIPLWTVPVAANATSIVFSSATAVFPYTAAAGGIVPVRGSTDKPAAANGVQYRHRLDVAAGGTSPTEWSTDGTNWNPVYDATTVSPAWTAYTPTFSGTLGTGTVEGTYSKIGRLVTARVNLVWGSGTTTGAIALGLPFAAANVAFSPGYNYVWAGSAYAIPPTGNVRVGATTVAATGSSMSAFSDNTSAAFWSATSPLTWASGTTFVFQITYESAT